MAQCNLLLTLKQAFPVQPTANVKANIPSATYCLCQIGPFQCNLLLTPKQAFPAQPTANNQLINIPETINQWPAKYTLRYFYLEYYYCTIHQISQTYCTKPYKSINIFTGLVLFRWFWHWGNNISINSIIDDSHAHA